MKNGSNTTTLNEESSNNIVSLASRRKKRTIDSLKIVEIDCAYDTWDNPETQKIFARNVGLKFRGYQKDFPYGVLPADKGDYFATHLLVCDQTNGDLRPILAFQSVSLSRCLEFDQPFPVLSMLDASGAPEQGHVLREIIAQVQKKGMEVTYSGTRAIDPDVFKSKELMLYLRDMTYTMLMRHQLDRGIGLDICVAIPRLNTQKVLVEMNYDRLKSDKGVEFPIFPNRPFFNEETLLYIKEKQFPEKIRIIADSYKTEWENRIIIADSQRHGQLRKAA